MKYTENGDRITLEMSRDDFERLLMMTGFATGAAKGTREFYMWIKLVNDMNATNPHFTPYEIPAEFRQ